MLKKCKKILNEVVLSGFNVIGHVIPPIGIPVLCYHSANGENPGSVKKNFFYKQMNYLHEKGITTISLTELVDYVDNKKEIPERSIVLTFDDGYKSNYEIAFPVLKKFNFKATIFLTTGRIGKTVDWEGKGIFGLPLMNWAEIRVMTKYGIDFGAHTETHPHLTKISTDNVKNEIRTSKIKVEDETGKPVHFFAYPYGDYNYDVMEIIREINFMGACTTDPGLNAPGQNLFALKRSGVFINTSLTGFRTRLNGTFPWYFHAKRAILKKP